MTVFFLRTIMFLKNAVAFFKNAVAFESKRPVVFDTRKS